MPPAFVEPFCGRDTATILSTLTIVKRCDEQLLHTRPHFLIYLLLVLFGLLICRWILLIKRILTIGQVLLRSSRVTDIEHSESGVFSLLSHLDSIISVSFEGRCAVPS
jgi:hypothetical protein